jgi:hypothetical protein
MRMATRRLEDRGTALIIALILVTVLSVVGLALVKRANSEIDAVGAKRKYDTVATCADAARLLAASGLHNAYLNGSPVDINMTIGNLTMYTGHYTTTDGGSGYVPDGGAYAVLPSVNSASSGGASDVSNKVSNLKFGATPFRVTVVCQDANNPNRQTEIEFYSDIGL